MRYAIFEKDLFTVDKYTLVLTMDKNTFDLVKGKAMENNFLAFSRNDPLLTDSEAIWNLIEVRGDKDVIVGVISFDKTKEYYTTERAKKFFNNLAQKFILSKADIVDSGNIKGY